MTLASFSRLTSSSAGAFRIDCGRPFHFYKPLFSHSILAAGNYKNL